MAPKRARPTSVEGDAISKRARDEGEARESGGTADPITSATASAGPTSTSSEMTGRDGIAKTDAGAVRALNRLGVEPGAVANAGLNDLNLIIGAVHENNAAAIAHYSNLEDREPGGASQTTHPATAAAPAETPAATTVAAPTLYPGEHHVEKMAALQALTAIGVDSARVSDWTTTQIKRMRVLLTWVDERRHTYAITKGPAKQEWGIAAPFKDTSNVLCVGDTATPITFWLTGEVSSMWFFDYSGYPANRASLGIHPLIGSTGASCAAQLNEKCMPVGSSKVAESFGAGQVKASRWMTTRGANGQPGKSVEFKELYDARQALKDKSLLQPLSVSQLKQHDIVVMEVRLCRYAVREEGGNDKGKRRMDNWQAFYDLLAVYKIKDAVEKAATPDDIATFEI